jgi:hypothetical protein
VTLTASQFGRAVQVEIIPPVGDGVLINPDVAPGATQLRVAVTVSKGIGAPASCVVDIHNMSRASRDRAAGVTRRVVDFSDEVGTLDGRLVFGDQFGDGRAEVVTRSNGFGYIRVSAFYQGAGTTVALFRGTTQRVIPPQTGSPTKVTRIIAGDGVVQDAAAVTNRQWRQKVSAAFVLEYVIREVMGTTLAGAEVGNFAAGLPPAVRDLQLVAGYDATALYATDILSEFARVTRTQWWWDDGEIYWIPADQGLDRPPIILDTKPASGSYQLLGTPQPAEDNQVRVPLLLLPELRPGSPVQIRSGSFAGDYYCRAVEHAVDNRGSAVAKTFGVLARTGVLPFE